MLTYVKPNHLELKQNLPNQHLLRQFNNIQANNSNEENSENSQIYSVATVNKVTTQHKYVEVHLDVIPIETLVDCGSNATILTRVIPRISNNYVRLFSFPFNNAV